MLAYGKHIAMPAGNSGDVCWSVDKTIFYLNGPLIYLSRFRQLAQDLVGEMEKVFWQGLFWTADIKDRYLHDLKQTVDDVTFIRRRVLFVDQGNNKTEKGTLINMRSKAICITNKCRSNPH
ncbi:hypothetical protein GQ44DRAFT_732592 [Phaeosphaeriaceae sp. PMI808]|nr:hypothetical protein GQ44DRAFT_732592 [Phaeosphaeriaceae sp. PMI808]